MFLVLSGSVARGDYSKDSDIDVCRIDCTCEVSRDFEWPSGPINYIDYTLDEFERLYCRGSLFIFHILYEGILIKGDEKNWNMLKLNFICQDNFDEELTKIINTFDTFDNIEIFGGKYLTMYSNLFTLVKNYSIFYLAKKRLFVFNKEKAVKTIFGDFYFDMLMASYNYFERGILNNNWNYDCKTTAIEIKKHYLSIMEGIKND
jgi:hypothetical protein